MDEKKIKARMLTMILPGLTFVARGTTWRVSYYNKHQRVWVCDDFSGYRTYPAFFTENEIRKILGYPLDKTPKV